jgi:hypothetical protein
MAVYPPSFPENKCACITHLEQAEQSAADGQLPPRFDKGHADHDDTKAQYDEREPDAGADSAEDNVGGELLPCVSIPPVYILVLPQTARMRWGRRTKMM